MKNKSGHEVLYDKVLVHLSDVLKSCTVTPDGYYKKGLLIYSREQMTTESEQETEGVIVDLGEQAFEGLKKRPKIGDRITFPKYAGFVIYGDDGQFYRRLFCKEIGTLRSTKKK